MNPQQNDDTATLKARLSQLPQARPAAPVNVPARSNSPSRSLQDIDDSAYAIGGDSPRPVVVPQQPAAPVAQVQPVVAPLPPAVHPQPMPVAPPATIMPPRAVPPVPAATPPQAARAQIAAAPVAPPPAATPVAPISRPPVAAQQPLPPQQPAPASPPQPMTQAVSFSPKPAAAASSIPASPVGFQPATQHVARDLVERIDETPQQNSSDIENLIQHSHRLRKLKGFVSFLLFLAGVVLAAFLLNQFVFQSYYVDGTSMNPTLQNDDRLIIDKIGHSWANLQGKPYIPPRGQIVVLDSSIVGINGREQQLIKRVIGLPGDTLIVKDGVVTIKNKEHPEGFDVDKQLGLNLQPTFSEAPLEVTIHDNEVFVMGDNRAGYNSFDSRSFGAIQANKIVGRLWVRILPLDKVQIF